MRDRLKPGDKPVMAVHPVEGLFRLSGHGVCGLARLSKRSFVAVGIFFSVAILTVTVTGIV